MAYRFKLAEKPTKALHRVGTEQFDRALAQLDTAEAQTAIHETRKCIKRLRAMLRLVRSGISGADWRELDHALRDAARGLSAARDRDVLGTTALRLSTEHADAAELLRAIAHRLRQGGSAKKTTVLRRKAGTVLRAAREKWLSLNLEPDDFTVLEAGLERNLEAIADRHHACADGEDETFHDLRKAIQRHWRQMRLVEEGWPAYFGARADEAKEISELLGVAQDLTLFIGWLGSDQHDGLAPDETGAITELARQTRTELRKAARARCVRLIADKPHTHARQAGELWSSAEQIDKIEPTALPEVPPASAPASVALHAPAATTRAPRKISAQSKSTAAGPKRKKRSPASL